jgi:PAS domain S-box-containing protein
LTIRIFIQAAPQEPPGKDRSAWKTAGGTPEQRSIWAIMARSARQAMPYLVALAAVAAAALIRESLDPLLGGGTRPFITFFAAVAVSAWYGGLWPGLLSILLSFLVADYFFIPPRFSLNLLDVSTQTVTDFIVFVTMSGLIVVLSEALHRANARTKEEARLAAQAAKLYQITLGSIGDAVIATDTEGRVSFLNQVAESLTGWKLSESLHRPLGDIFHIINEQTRNTVEDPCAKVLRSGVVVGLANHTVLIAKDGTELPVDDSAAPIFDYEGEVAGVVLVFRDVTKRRARERQIQESERLKTAIIQGALDCIIEIDHEDRILEFNPAAEQTFGFRREDVLGQKLVDLIIPQSLRERHRQAMAHYLATGEGPILGKRIEMTGLRADGTEFPIELTVIRSPLEGPPMFTAYLRDITERQRAEAVMEFLAQTRAALAALVDRDSALQQAAGAMVPFFADWCVLYTISSEGNIEHQACAHRDPEKQRNLKEMLDRYPFDWSNSSASVQALRSGEAQFIADLPDALLTNIARDQTHIDLLRALDPKSIISIPLRVRDRTIGTITFVATEPSRLYTPGDVRFAEELARSVAIAIDNAHLFNSVKTADRQKDEFLAMLAHELRTPLAAIRYATEVARLPEVDPKVELLDIVERQVQNLVRLIDDLLDISRISRGKILLRREYLDASVIARRAVASVRPILEGKNHELDFELAEEPMPIYADPMRAEQTVVNLLTNAVKYTHDGGRVSLRVYPEDQEVVIRIKDTGIGIAPEILPRVFDLFTQADQSLDRSQGGLGVGLAVTRRLVEMHGGTVAAHSEGVGHGSEFTLRLPLCDAVPPEDSTIPIRAERPATSLRILVVDDNRDTADTEALLLRAHGHQVEVAHDGPAALELAHQFRPHVFLLDLGLPGLNGYEVAVRLRKEGFANEPLIAISGYGQPDDRERCRQAGFDHHLVKPVENSALLALLREVEPEETSAM